MCRRYTWKLEALCAKAGLYAPGRVKLFKWRAVELRRRPPSTEQEQALTDLDVGVRQEREWVLRHISAAEFQRRKPGHGLVELTRVEGERGMGVQHAGLWREISGGACATSGVQSSRVSGRLEGG